MHGHRCCTISLMLIPCLLSVHTSWRTYWGTHFCLDCSIAVLRIKTQMINYICCNSVWFCKFIKCDWASKNGPSWHKLHIIKKIFNILGFVKYIFTFHNKLCIDGRKFIISIFKYNSCYDATKLKKMVKSHLNPFCWPNYKYLLCNNSMHKQEIILFVKNIRKHWRHQSYTCSKWA